MTSWKLPYRRLSSFWAQQNCRALVICWRYKPPSGLNDVWHKQVGVKDRQVGRDIVCLATHSQTANHFALVFALFVMSNASRLCQLPTRTEVKSQARVSPQRESVIEISALASACTLSCTTGEQCGSLIRNMNCGTLKRITQREIFALTHAFSELFRRFRLLSGAN